MRPALTLLCCCAPLAALAGLGAPSPVQCDEEWADCKETCSMEFGTSTRQAVRAKFKKCMKQCHTRERECREAVLDAAASGAPQAEPERNNQPFDPNAADRPAERAAPVDPANAPYRATSADERAEAAKKIEDEHKAEQARRAEEARRRAEAQRAQDKKGTAMSRPVEDARAPEKASRGGTDSKPRPRDDGAELRGQDEAAPPAREEPKKDKRAAPPPAGDEAPKKKKDKEPEKKRALDEWDPDAL